MVTAEFTSLRDLVMHHAARHGWKTQRRVATTCGVDETAFSRFLDGRQDLGAVPTFQIFQAVNVPIDQYPLAFELLRQSQVQARSLDQARRAPRTAAFGPPMVDGQASALPPMAPMPQAAPPPSPVGAAPPGYSYPPAGAPPSRRRFGGANPAQAVAAVAVAILTLIGVWFALNTRVAGPSPQLASTTVVPSATQIAGSAPGGPVAAPPGRNESDPRQGAPVGARPTERPEPVQRTSGSGSRDAGPPWALILIGVAILVGGAAWLATRLSYRPSATPPIPTPANETGPLPAPSTAYPGDPFLPPSVAAPTTMTAEEAATLFATRGFSGQQISAFFAT